MCSYVLITPAKNEENYIEKTIQSVISQTLLPQKWIIVNNGSTDKTEEIVNRYTAKYKFIELVHFNENTKRNFAAKIGSFNAGYQRLKYTHYDFLGNLDADISFSKNYYEEILKKFMQNLRLGIGGGIIIDFNDKNKRRPNYSRNNVGCAIQMFRRECFENIGGYLPLKIGGEDAAAEVLALMNQWEVQAFPELEVFHHREMGTGNWNIWVARFYRGVEHYSLGYHPLFFIFKSFSRFWEKPWLLGSLLMLTGYLSSCISQEKRIVSNEFVDFLRKKQLKRMRNSFVKSLNIIKLGKTLILL